MKRPFLQRRTSESPGRGERGITMVLVAVCMVAIIAMAALSIDVVTLYVAREEAQRAADAAALAAARVISVSGITGTADPDTDTTAWQAICGGSTSLASLAATAAARVNAVGGIAPTVSVTYSVQAAGAGNADCSGLAQAFAINPAVTVQVTRGNMPTLFSRIWSRNANSVSATAVAEVFNPSDSGTIAPGGQVIPVQPRCVKPWILPDADPGHAGHRFSRLGSGSIRNPGIFSIDGGVIGENITLTNPCLGPNCTSMEGSTPLPGQYLPVLVTPPATAVSPSCANGNFENAIVGCDVNTVYACGYQGTFVNPSPTQADLTEDVGPDTVSAVQCATGMPGGNDTIDTSSYPFQIKAGSSNPIAPANQVITSSNSIMTIPLYDGAPLPPGISQPHVNIVGFLQVFVNSVNSTGDMNVNVLNVAGCGNNASNTLSAPGTSPVPVRLISPN